MTTPNKKELKIAKRSMRDFKKSSFNIRYLANKAAKIGDICECAYCTSKFTKKQYSQAFCCNQCKTAWWDLQGDRHSIAWHATRALREMNKQNYSFCDDRCSGDDGMTDRDWDEAFGVAEYND